MPRRADHDDPPTIAELRSPNFDAPYAGDDTPTLNVPIAQPEPAASDDVPTLHVPAPKLAPGDTPTLAIPAPRMVEREDPQTLSMSVEQQRALIASRSAPPLPGELTFDGNDVAPADTGDFDTPTMVGGITAATSPQLKRPSTPPPLLGDDVPTPRQVLASTNDDNESPFDAPTVQTKVHELKPPQSPPATRQPTIAERGLDAEVSTSPSTMLRKSIMLGSAPDRTSDDAPRPQTLPPDALLPLPQPAWRATDPALPLAPTSSVAPMPLPLSEADITTAPSTTLPAGALDRPDPSLEQITAPTKPPISQLAGVMARPALTPSPALAPPPAAAAAEPEAEPEPSPEPPVEHAAPDAFRESTAEAFRPAAPAASLEALAGLKRASTTSSQSTPVAAPPSPPRPASTPAAAPPKAKAKAPPAKTGKVVKVSPARGPALTSEFSAAERRRFTLIAASVCAVVLVLFVGSRFVGRGPKVASLPPIALPSEAVACTRVTTIGKDLICEAEPKTLNALPSPDRNERLRVTKEAAAAAGFARVVFTEKEKVWRVLELGAQRR